MTSTQRLCTAIQHNYGAQPDGSWAESYVDSNTGATLFTQPIQPYKPTQTPPAQVGLENDWCVLAQQQQQTQEVVATEVIEASVSTGSPMDGLIVMGVAILSLIGVGGLGLALSYRIKPDPTMQFLPAKNPPHLLPATELEHLDFEDEAEPAAVKPAERAEKAIGTSQWDEEEDAPIDTSADEQRLRDALGYPAVLIYGASGSGKSTLARWFIHERQQIGHTVEVCDPHRAYGQWEDVDHYGDGLDYQACDERLHAFSEKVENRYRTLAQRPNYNPRPHTLLTEEFTNWATQCPHAGSFFASSMSDLRKVNMHALYVAHGRTLSALGGSSGTAKQRDNSLLEIELDVAIDGNGRPVPSGKGHIKYPQQNKRVPFTVPPCVSEFADGKTFVSNESANTEIVELLGKIATEIKKQAAQKEGGHITVRSAAQCLPSDRRSTIYPKMPEYCKALAEMYPEEFEVFQGVADEWRVAYLKSPNYNGEAS